MSSSAGKWYHICGTWDASNKKVSVYRDGELAASGNSTVTTFNNISSTVNLVYGGEWDICDFRMYDHSLSAKEVKEISKALVLHYKLDETYGMTNMAAGKASTCYNNYGTGMTYTKTDINESYMGQKVYRWTYTMVNDSCVSGFKSGYHSRGIYGSPTYFGASGSNISFVYWIYYRPQTSGLTAGGTASNIGGWTEIPREYVGDGWWRVGQYRTNNTSTRITTDNIFTSLNWPYAGVGSSCTIDFVEMGWLLSGTTSIPSNFVDGNSVVHDCSGYLNNGDVSASQQACISSSDTARYDASVLSNNPSAYSVISCPVDFSIDKFTFSAWRKPIQNTTSDNTSAMEIMLNIGSIKTIHFFTYINYPYTQISGTTAVVYPYKYVDYWNDGNWHMMTTTYDGNAGIIYIDGEEIHRVEGNAGKINGDKITIFTRNELLSDFRIYGTALSPDDVKELYHTAASVDNHGNFFCGELKEV
jgi:hypothetical protein